MTERETLVAGDEYEHTALAAELVARAIDRAVRERGVARVALSGGTTPGATYRRLAAMALPFERIEWYWVDERAGAPDSARSNFHAARVDLGLDRPGAKSAGVFRMEAEDPDLGAAASRYERVLRRAFGVAGAVAFDAMTLGIGDDGHTASLFPGMGATAIDDRLVAAIEAQPARGLEARITLTAPVIREARLVVMIVRGEKKRGPIAAAWSDGPEEEIPARVLGGAKGKVVWVLDQAASPSA
jgi:6-phosphogluconolactonase